VAAVDPREIRAWLENVRCRAMNVSTPEHLPMARLLTNSPDSREEGITQGTSSGDLLSEAVSKHLLSRVQPLFDRSAVRLANKLASGSCNLALMPVPYRYFRHWSIEVPQEVESRSTKGALFLLGNSAIHYLRMLPSLSTPNETVAEHIAFHLTRCVVDNRWQWILRVPVRNLGPEPFPVIRVGPVELRLMTKPEESDERKRSGTGYSFPSGTFVYEGRAARPPQTIQTLPAYLIVRTEAPYPDQERKGSRAPDELRPSDRAQALLCAVLLACQLFGFEPESDGRASQVAYPHWLLNVRRTRPTSLPPSRPGFRGPWVTREQLQRIVKLADKIPGDTFTGSQDRLAVALRRFHHAVALGVSRAGFLEHIAALESVLEMGANKMRWRTEALRTTDQSGLLEEHADELKALHKLRSKTVHAEIEPSDDCLTHTVNRVRFIASLLLCSILGIHPRPYSGRSHGDLADSVFELRKYLPNYSRTPV
jgi:hypothetical protein